MAHISLLTLLHLTYTASQGKRNGLYSGMGAWRAAHSARPSEIKWYTVPRLALSNTARPCDAMTGDLPLLRNSKTSKGPSRDEAHEQRSASMSTKITMPQLGESVNEGTIGQWLKQEGETVKKDEALV